MAVLCFIALLFITGIVSGDDNFRGAYLTYAVESSDANSMTIRAYAASQWRDAATDCQGEIGRVYQNQLQLDAIGATESFNNFQFNVACNETDLALRTRTGYNDWLVGSVPRARNYQLSYLIQSPWRTLPCCANTQNVAASDSITLSVTVTSVPNDPPFPHSLPSLQVTQGNLFFYRLMVTDKENNVIRCRLATNVAESGVIFQFQQASVAQGTGCLLVIDATSKSVGEYPVAVIIEDFNSLASNVPLHSVPFQIVYSVVAPVIPSTVTCTPNNMVVSVPTNFFVDGVPTANRVSFTDQNCQSNVVGGNFVLSTALNQCGTLFIGETATHLVYQNTVIFRRAVVGTITREQEVRITATCRYERNQISQGAKSYIANTLIQSNEENFGAFVLELRAFDSIFVNPITVFPMNVILGQRQYCQIDVQANNPDVVVIVERIFASNNPNRNVGPFYNMIFNRCPADNTVSFNNQLATKDQFRFSFDAFAFTVDVTQPVYIHCDTFLCHRTSTDPRCNQVCTGDNGNNMNNVNRVPQAVGRRSIEEGTDIDLDTPSKTYYLVAGPFQKMPDNDDINEMPAPRERESFWNEQNFLIISFALVIVCIVVVAFLVLKLGQAKVSKTYSVNPPFSQDVKKAFDSSA